MRYASSPEPQTITRTSACCWSIPERPPRSPPRDVRSFLKGLLSDPRVIELPRLLWLPILYGLILPFRPARIARKYRSIWTPDGSPLVAISAKLRTELTRALAQRTSARSPLSSACCIRRRSVQDALRRLRDLGARQLIVAAAVSAVFRRDDRRRPRPGHGRAGSLAAAAGAALHFRLSRSPGLHRGAACQRRRALGRRAQDQASGDVLPRHSEALRAGGRSLLSASASAPRDSWPTRSSCATMNGP